MIDFLFETEERTRQMVKHFLDLKVIVLKTNCDRCIVRLHCICSKTHPWAV